MGYDGSDVPIGTIYQMGVQIPMVIFGEWVGIYMYRENAGSAMQSG